MAVSGDVSPMTGRSGAADSVDSKVTGGCIETGGVKTSTATPPSMVGVVKLMGDDVKRDRYGKKKTSARWIVFLFQIQQPKVCLEN